MGVIAGTGGYIAKDGAGLACIGDFTIGARADLRPFVCNATKRGSKRTVGVKRWTASWNWFGAMPSYAFKPGEIITFGGALTDDVACLGSIAIESIEVRCPISQGGSVSGSIAARGLGALTLSEAASLTPATALADECSAANGKVAIADVASSPSFTDLVDVAGWTLRARAQLNDYATNTTGTWGSSTVGPIDFDVTIDMLTDNPSDLVVLNAVHQLRLYADATRYYDARWARVADVQGPRVNIGTGEPVAASIVLAQDAIQVISATPTAGYLKYPGGSALWDGTV